MIEVSVRNALNGAELVRVNDMGAEDLVQVWYGGTQVNVYVFGSDGTVSETGVWTLSDQKGRPPEQGDVWDHMLMHAQYVIYGSDDEEVEER